MKLDFEHMQEVGSGSYPDLIHFPNTQGQVFYVKDGKLYGMPTNAIDEGKWENAIFENEVNVSPDIDISHFEINNLSGFGAIGGYKAGNEHRMLLYEFGDYDYRNYVKYLDHIEIRNQDGNKTAYLSPQTDGVKDCYLDTRLNGESTLEFLLPATSPKIDELTPECTLYAGWKAYMLRKDDAIDFVRDDKNRLWAKVMAHERWYELGTSYVEPSISNDPTAKPPADLAVIIVGAGSNLTEDRYVVGTAAHALYAILEGSDWHLGICDVEGIHDLEAEKESRLTLIKMVQDIWGGYLVFDSVNKVIHLRDPNKWQPYNGFQIRYKKNLKHITRTQSNKIYTKIYPFGHDDLDIASVNDGKKYITNYSYTSRNYIGIYKNQDIYDAQELKDKAEAELELNCKPRYNYKVKIADLRTLPEYAHEEFSLGDMADVVDPSAGNVRIRILRHKYNLFQPWDCEIELGDPEERLIQDLKAAFDTSSFIGSIFNSRGLISGKSIEDLTIVADKIANATITGSKIDNLTITANNIANLTITGGKIANATITDAKIKDLSADKITAGTITADISIMSPYIYGAEIDGGTITGSLFRTDIRARNRIEISSIGFVPYDSSNRIHGPAIDVGDAGMAFYYRDNIVGAILTGSDAFQLVPFGGCDMYIGDTRSYIYAYGEWSFTGSGSRIGFFGNTPVAQQTAQLLSMNATLFDVIIKLNGLMDKLNKYGLFYVYS